MFDGNERLIEIAREFWDRQGEPNYNSDGLEGYVLLNLLEGNDEEASRAMALHGPYEADVYGLFLHVGLILAYCRYGEHLSEAARERLRQTLKEVATTTNRIYVWDFWFVNDNWPMCASAIQVLGGEILGNQDLIQAGLDKLRHYSRLMAAVGSQAHRPCGVSSEHNSPTYTAVQITPMTVLARCSQIEEAQVRGQNWSEFLFMDLASHWHRDLQQQCGPYARAYQDNLLGGAGTTRLLLNKVWGPLFIDPEVAWQQDHQHDLAFAAIVAATDYECPSYLRHIALHKSYPYEVKASCALYTQDTAYPCNLGPSSVELYSYLTDRWMLGSASRGYHAHIGQATSPIVHWRRRAPVQTMQDFGVMYFRYQFDDKLPNQENWEAFSDSFRETCHLREDGHLHDLQHENTVVHLTQPQWYFRQAESLKQSALVPLYAEVEEVYAGGQQIAEFPYQSAQAETVFVRDSGVAIGLRPLEVTNLGREVCTRVEKANDHLIISWYNYQGPRREFSFDELIRMQNGLVVQVADCPDEESFRQFQQRLESAQLADEIVGDQRQVAFGDGQVSLEGSLSLTFGNWTERVVNGEPFQPEIFRSPHLHQAQGGRCQVGETVLECPADMALRLVALEDQGTYAVYNFYEESARFRLSTPHGAVEGGPLPFGKVVYRATDAGLEQEELLISTQRWRIE